MSLLQFNDDDFRQMKRAEDSIIQALIPFRQNTEAALVCFALARCLRVLLRLYPEATQQQLREVLEDYLRGELQPRALEAGGRTESGLIVPPSFLQ